MVLPSPLIVPWDRHRKTKNFGRMAARHLGHYHQSIAIDTHSLENAAQCRMAYPVVQSLQKPRPSALCCLGRSSGGYRDKRLLLWSITS